MVGSQNVIFCKKKNLLLTLINELVHYRERSANFIFHDILTAHDEYAPANAS